MAQVAGLVPVRTFLWHHDLASTSYLYQLYGLQCAGYGGIKTSGNSTTITSVSGLAIPAFTSNGVGDLLEIRTGGAGGTVPYTSSIRKIVTYTDADTVVVDTAINIGSSGTSSWSFNKVAGGATASDGWLHIGDLVNRTVFLAAPTLGETDGVDFVIQGKVGTQMDNDIFTLYTHQVVAADAGWTAAVPVGEDVNFLRVGVKSHTASTGTDSVSAYLEGRQVR